MVKNKKGKVIQMLSPENYIRKKARTLPLFECVVTSDWEETKMTTVIIARNHTSGNITACSYVVDLDCLGVKDSMFLFNVSPLVYSEYKEKINGRLDMMEVDYTLAHNIILAGVEFAAEFGFKPYKEYESITKFMLEEDTEEIELIEIECGKDGKPFYVQGPFEDDVRSRQIIAQLEKTAGRGNYDFLLSADDEFNGQYDEDDLEVDEFEFADWNFEEKKELFIELAERLDDLTEEGAKRLLNLTDSMADDLVDEDQYNQFYKQYMEDVDIEIKRDKVPVELLGLKPGDQPVSEELIIKFLEIYKLSADNPELATKELKLFHKESKGIPGAYFLELIILQDKKSGKYAKRLKEYAQTFPDYALIQLLWATSQVTTKKDMQNIPGYPFTRESFFPGRESISPIEVLYLLIFYSFATGIELDINKIEAFASVLFDLEIPEPAEQVMEATNALFRFTCIMKAIIK